MAIEMRKTIKIFYFYSYSPRDTELKNALKLQLTQEYIIHLDDVPSGKNQQEEIGEYIDTADVILLLISPDFISSDYIYSQEMKRALERHGRKETRMIPIILRPINWESTPFGGLPALPRGGQAVSIWKSREQVLYKIAKEILSVTDEICSRKWLESVEEYKKNEQYEEAVNVCEQAIHFGRKLPLFYQYKGDLLFHLKRFKDAFNSYDYALKIAPQNVQLLRSLGRTLVELERYDDALTAYNRVTELTSRDANLSIEIGDIYFKLNRFTEALTAYDEAINLAPRAALFHMKRGDALLRSNRHKEALAAYDQAIYLQDNNALFHSQKGDALLRNSNYKEALVAYDKAISLEENNPLFYKSKARVLLSLARTEGDSVACFEEALVAYECAIFLDPNDPFLYKGMGDALSRLLRLEEALEAYEDAIRLRPDFGLAYRSKAQVLEQIAKNTKQQAQQAYEKAKELGSLE